MNHVCSFSELFAKQNAANNKNGKEGSNGMTAPIAPITTPGQPRIM